MLHGVQSALNPQPPETLSTRDWKNMSTPKLGRNARLFKDGTVIGYAKDIGASCRVSLALDPTGFPSGFTKKQ